MSHPIPTFSELFSLGDSRGPSHLLLIHSCVGGLRCVRRKPVFFREDGVNRVLLHQILAALAYCHKCGVYHRDLNTENVVVSAQIEVINVLVADFSLAITICGAYVRRVGVMHLYFVCNDRTLAQIAMLDSFFKL